LIALIAKARLLTLPIGSERLGAKRPVLLQTHPGTRAVRLRAHDWLLDRKTEDVRMERSALSSLVRIPATECASSSRCQRSDDREQTT